MDRLRPMPEAIPLIQKTTWQETLSDVLTDPQALYNFLELTPEEHPIPVEVLKSFPLRVPQPFLARINKRDPTDPLLLQVLPSAKEAELTSGYSEDPLEEKNANPSPGVLHKYHGRVLLMPTSSCAIHCRYCFRRHFPYQDNTPNKAQWEHSLSLVRNNKRIEEVILSGGDPLAISDRHLDWLISSLESIPHLKRLRFHTRLPIMIPQRITDLLCHRLFESPLLTSVVLHSNHAQEFDQDVDNACQQLRNANVTLLNQSVLLHGINDNKQALSSLSKRLFQAGVLPYYLHMPDKTQGTAHFSVSDDAAQSLMTQLQKELPGYLIPKLVREIPDRSSKTLIF